MREAKPGRGCSAIDGWMAGWIYQGVIAAL
jgi:hypothetical protein